MLTKKPNLVDEGEGLFFTHITWEMLEDAMQKAFNTKATFGPNKSIRDLAEGVGFSSIVALVTADWQNVEIADLPDEFVAKLTSCVQGKKMVAAMDQPEGYDINELYAKWEIINRQLHNSEGEFYKYVKEHAECYEDFRIPKLYYTKRFDSSEDVIGFTIMEFLEDIEVLHLYHNALADKVDQVLRAIARLQAFSLKGDYREHHDLSRNSFSDVYEQLMDCDQMMSMLEGVRTSFEDEKIKNLLHDVMKVAPEIYNFDRFSSECLRRGMEKVFVHGDMWSANVCWDKETKNLRALVDFQIVHLGSPAEDIARLLLTTMGGQERRENEEILLEKFYAHLEEFLGDMPRPYTLQQLIDNYRAILPLSALINACMFGPVLNYALLKITDETEKKKAADTVREKVTALFEDCLKYHKINNN